MKYIILTAALLISCHRPVVDPPHVSDDAYSQMMHKEDSIKWVEEVKWDVWMDSIKNK